MILFLGSVAYLSQSEGAENPIEEQVDQTRGPVEPSTSNEEDS